MWTSHAWVDFDFSWYSAVLVTTTLHLKQYCCCLQCFLSSYDCSSPSLKPKGTSVLKLVNLLLTGHCREIKSWGTQTNLSIHMQPIANCGIIWLILQDIRATFCSQLSCIFLSLINVVTVELKGKNIMFHTANDSLCMLDSQLFPLSLLWRLFKCYHCIPWPWKHGKWYTACHILYIICTKFWLFTTFSAAILDFCS